MAVVRKGKCGNGWITLCEPKDGRCQPRLFTYLIYKAKSVCLCVWDMCTCFLLHRHQTRCGCWGHWGQVIAGLTLPVLRFAASYPFISAFSFADDRHFPIIVLVDFRFLLDLIGCHPMFEFKPITIILNCSSNMVVEGIGDTRQVL